MKIQVNTDNNIEGNVELEKYVNESLSSSLAHYKNALTRLEVHLSDANGEKSGADDKKCLIEARVANHTPLVASHESDNIHQAINMAGDKILKSLDKMEGKMNKRPQSIKDFQE